MGVIVFESELMMKSEMVFEKGRKVKSDDHCSCCCFVLLIKESESTDRKRISVLQNSKKRKGWMLISRFDSVVKSSNQKMNEKNEK